MAAVSEPSGAGDDRCRWRRTVAAGRRSARRRARRLALLGIGMGFAIVALAVVGVKLLRRPERARRAAPVAAQAPARPETAGRRWWRRSHRRRRCGAARAPEDRDGRPSEAKAASRRADAHAARAEGRGTESRARSPRSAPPQARAAAAMRQPKAKAHSERALRSPPEGAHAAPKPARAGSADGTRRPAPLLRTRQRPAVRGRRQGRDRGLPRGGRSAPNDPIGFAGSGSPTSSRARPRRRSRRCAAT